jgi:hypothetical protein
VFLPQKSSQITTTKTKTPYRERLLKVVNSFFEVEPSVASDYSGKRRDCSPVFI